MQTGSGSKAAILALLFVLIVAAAIHFSYHDNGTYLSKQQVIFLESIVEYLEGANFIIPVAYVEKIKFSVLDFFGSILVCRHYRSMTLCRSGKSWLEALVASCLLQFGGTTLTGILLGQTPSWILSHTAAPAFLLAFWLVHFSPFDIFWIISSNPLFLFVSGAFSAISAGHAVTSWGLDKARLNAFHVNGGRIGESLFTCILAGTFSACGGGILVDILGLLATPSSPAVFTPGTPQAASLSRSFLLSSFYYVLITPACWTVRVPLVPRRESGHAVIVLLQLLHFLVGTLDRAADPLSFIAGMLRASLCVTPFVGLLKATPAASAVAFTPPRPRSSVATADKGILVVTEQAQQVATSSKRATRRAVSGSGVPTVEQAEEEAGPVDVKKRPVRARKTKKDD